MKDSNNFGFDAEVSQIILKVLEDEIGQLQRFEVLERKVFEKLKPYLNLPERIIAQSFERLKTGRAITFTGPDKSIFTHFRFFQKIWEQLKLIDSDTPHEETTLQIALLMECQGIGEASMVQRYLFHLDDPNKTFDAEKFQRVIKCSKHAGLPSSERKFFNHMINSDWLEEYEDYCYSQDSSELQMRLQKNMRTGFKGLGLVKNFEKEYLEKQGSIKLFNGLKLSFLSSLALVVSSGVVYHIVLYLKSLQAVLYLPFAVLLWCLYLISSGYLLKRIWLRSGFCSKDDFMDEMLKSNKLRWIRVDDLNDGQRFSFMNNVFGEKMRDRTSRIKDELKIISKGILKKDVESQWQEVLRQSKLSFVLAIHRELARHSDLLSSEAGVRGEEVQYSRYMNIRAKSILDKASRLIARPKTNQTLPYGIDAQLQKNLSDFEDRVRLSLDYLESQQDLGVEDVPPNDST